MRIHIWHSLFTCLTHIENDINSHALFWASRLKGDRVWEYTYDISWSHSSLTLKSTYILTPYFERWDLFQCEWGMWMRNVICILAYPILQSVISIFSHPTLSVEIFFNVSEECEWEKSYVYSHTLFFTLSYPYSHTLPPYVYHMWEYRYGVKNRVWEYTYDIWPMTYIWNVICTFSHPTLHTLIHTHKTFLIPYSSLILNDILTPYSSHANTHTHPGMSHSMWVRNMGGGMSYLTWVRNVNKEYIIQYE